MQYQPYVMRKDHICFKDCRPPRTPQSYILFAALLSCRALHMCAVADGAVPQHMGTQQVWHSKEFSPRSPPLCVPRSLMCSLQRMLHQSHTDCSRMQHQLRHLRITVLAAAVAAGSSSNQALGYRFHLCWCVLTVDA